MTADEKADLARCVELLGNAPIVYLEIDAFSAFALVGTMQLALRHPGNVGHVAERMRDLARSIQEMLGKIDPLVERMCERGWHSCFDMPREGLR